MTPTIILILALKLIVGYLCQDIIVKVGLGYDYNFTLYVIDDSVTWYTAQDSCTLEVTGSNFGQLCNGHCAKTIANSISKLVTSSSSLIWIGRMKAEDDRIYTEGNCVHDGGLTPFIPNYEKNGLFKCVGLNLTDPEIEFLAIENCQAKHTYLCGKIDFTLNYEYNTRKRYYNVSVEVNPDIFELNPTGGNEQTCDDICNSWFRCAGYIYFPEDQMCHHIMDLTVNFDTTDDVMLVPSNTSFTVVRLKEEQRAFIKTVHPTDSRSDIVTAENNCHVLPDETTVTISTQNSIVSGDSTVDTAATVSDTRQCQSYTTSVYTCDCEISGTPVNKSTLPEWISNMTNLLSVDKTTLSSYSRRRNSAVDKRPSSKALGAFGVIIIIAVCTVIALDDASRFLVFIKGIMEELRSSDIFRTSKKL